MRADGERMRPGHVARVLALRSFPGLAQVHPTHLALLADLAKERTFGKGDTLLKPGTPVRSMHLIRGGSVAVLHENIVTRRFGATDIVGAVAALARLPEGQHVVAEEETNTFEIDIDDFEEVLEESFSILLAALRGTLASVMECRLKLPGNAGFPEPSAGQTERADAVLGPVERVLFLRRLMTYGRAQVEALAELAREMHEVRIPAGTELWRDGDPAMHSLLVWSGVIIGEARHGQRFKLGPDSVAGGIDSIAGEKRFYRAVAETDVVALRSDTAHLMDVIEEHPDMGLDMLRAAARILSNLYAALDRQTLG